jgi:hypothetical protein
MRRARAALSLSVVVVLVCLLAVPSFAPAEAVVRASPANATDAPGDEYWAAGFNLPGVNGSVSALAVGPDDSLYVGGPYFTFAGGVTANRIARWDGAHWHPLGNGTGGTVDPDVLALAFGPDGSLYAGGGFSTAGDKSSSAIAQWNGEAVRRCDFNNSGVVDVGDIMIVAALWNEAAGQLYDLDGDGVITVVDIQRVARWWGWAVPAS